jgi:ADP-ribosylation factor related protein 1
MFLQLVS